MPSVAGCPSASCSLAGFGCHPLQELGGIAKESGLGLNSAQPFHVPLCTCVWLTHDNGRSHGPGPRDPAELQPGTFCSQIPRCDLHFIHSTQCDFSKVLT